MWSLNQFKDWAVQQGSVAKYNDGQYKGECVSLINQYCYRVLNIPADAWGHAKDWATNGTPLQFFNRVGSVQAGDILVYDGTSGNPYGHIEIALGNGQALGQNRNLDGKVRIAAMLNNYSAILRSKNGGDMSQQSIDESDVGVLRIAHSEIGGWDLHETHSGRLDGLFLGAWRGKSYGDLIWGQWSAGAPYRDAKQAQLAFFNKYSAIVAELEARPTKAQLDKALADLAAEAANVKVVEKTIYTHDEATAQAVRDTLKTTKSVQGSLSNFIGWVKNKLGR